MYWSECGKQAAIETAAMDGTKRRTLVGQNLYWPVGLTIDYPANRLYWIDSKLRLVESVKLDGTSRKMVHQFPAGNKSGFHLLRPIRTALLNRFADMKPFKVDVFEDYLYVAMHQNNTVVRLNKFGFYGVSTLEAGLTRISDLVIYQENKQYVSGRVCEIHALVTSKL